MITEKLVETLGGTTYLNRGRILGNLKVAERHPQLLTHFHEIRRILIELKNDSMHTYNHMYFEYGTA